MSHGYDPKAVALQEDHIRPRSVYATHAATVDWLQSDKAEMNSRGWADASTPPSAASNGIVKLGHDKIVHHFMF
jgi:hypothetical protein